MVPDADVTPPANMAAQSNSRKWITRPTPALSTNRYPAVATRLPEQRLPDRFYVAILAKGARAGLDNKTGALLP
jgi:hypothetical protein